MRALSVTNVLFRIKNTKFRISKKYISLKDEKIVYGRPAPGGAVNFVIILHWASFLPKKYSFAVVVSFAVLYSLLPF